VVKHDRLTYHIDSSKRGGVLHRNLRISVYEVLEMLAEGMSETDIIETSQNLNLDIRACLAFAADATQPDTVARVMKLLTRTKICRAHRPFLQTAFPGSSQVALLGLERASRF